MGKKKSLEDLYAAKEKMIKFCQEFYKKEKRLPTARILNSRKDCMGATWVKKHFGGVTELLLAAGLPATKKPSQFAKKLFEERGAQTISQKKEILIEFAQNLRRELDRPLIANDFVDCDDRPNLITLQRIFGSLDNFWKAANLDKTRRSNNLTKEGLKDFLKSIRVNSDSDCWTTDRYTCDHNGYRFFHYNGRESRIHQVSYLLFNGEIGEGLVVMHSCDNRECYNPGHLSLGTQNDNIRDLVKKGKRDNQANRSGGFVRKFLPRDPYDKEQMKKFLEANTTLTQPFDQMIFNGSVKDGRYPEITISGTRYTLPRLILAQKKNVKYEEIETTRHILPDGSRPSYKDCNPDHLEDGSQSDNVRDCLSYRKNVKLCKKKLEDIRESYSKEVDSSKRGSQFSWQKRIAEKYKISKSYALEVGKYKQI